MKIFLMCLSVAAVLGQSSSDEETFKSLDLNGDGVVVYQELLTDFLQKDTNGDRRVSREEFSAKSFAGSTPLLVDAAFNYYDKLDGTKDDTMDESSVNSTFTILDSENDGEISFEDYEKNSVQIMIGVTLEVMALLEQRSS